LNQPQERQAHLPTSPDLIISYSSIMAARYEINNSADRITVHFIFRCTGAPVHNICGYCAGGIWQIQRWRDTVNAAAATTAKMMMMIMMMMQISVRLASAADTQYTGTFSTPTSFRIG